MERWIKVLIFGLVTITFITGEAAIITSNADDSTKWGTNAIAFLILLFGAVTFVWDRENQNKKKAITK